MKQEKLLHPSIDVLRVDGTDQEALEMAMVILHDIGWLTQQCGLDHAMGRMKIWHETVPDLFIRGCANGAVVLHKVLGRTAEEP